MAWEPLRWHPVAFAEIEPFACRALAQNWPEVPNLGDLTKITDERIRSLGPVDVVVGGTPCQDLSVAGQRRGIDGDRSSLFFDFVRLFDAARHFCGARWCVWENVPGAFGLNEGRDFAVVVSALAGCELAAPVEGWGNEGVALGDRGLVEWAVLDAQWFDLAQRRARVFAVLDTGDWANRPPILLEPESVRGDSAPSRETGARVAGTLTASALDGSSAGGGDGRDGLMVAATLTAREQKGPDSDATTTLVASTLCATGGRRVRAEDAAGGHLVAHTLTAEGFDASEDGSGRGIPLVADPITANEGGTYTHEGRGNFRLHNVIAAPLTHGGHPDSNAPGRRKEDDENLVACFDETQITHPENRSTADPETAALSARARPPAVAWPRLVRRLTPRECERLQGFPDDFTKLDGKTKDSPRYAALGNSMAVPVVRWIGERIEKAHGRRRPLLEIPVGGSVDLVRAFRPGTTRDQTKHSASTLSGFSSVERKP